MQGNTPVSNLGKWVDQNVISQNGDNRNRDNRRRKCGLNLELI